MNVPAAERLRAARIETDKLFDLLNPAAIYERPIPERHRLIFYLGHLEAFDWNQICRGALDLPSFHPEFDKLFEFGIDPEPGTAPSDQPADWPRVEEVTAYNQEVRRRLDNILQHAPDQIVHVALEHRLMHAETFAYLMHALPYTLKAQQTKDIETTGRVQNPMVDVPGGCVTLGQHLDQFGWDNEFAEHREAVSGFRMSKYKVTNGEFLDFIREGGEVPPFWTERDGHWFYRGMFAESPLPLDHPVYVTHEQARAYAAWAGYSLPTEPQFHRAAYGTDSDQERSYPWGIAAPAARFGNFDFSGWDPVSVAATPAGDSYFGISQLTGNGWEWTDTAFGPFHGFQEFPFYPGYSKNFFDGKHFVLKGGSPRTAACLLRRSFRNWFRPNYPYVYATFRLVENA